MEKNIFGEELQKEVVDALNKNIDTEILIKEETP